MEKKISRLQYVHLTFSDEIIEKKTHIDFLKSAAAKFQLKHLSNFFYTVCID